MTEGRWLAASVALAVVAVWPADRLTGLVVLLLAAAAFNLARPSRAAPDPRPGALGATALPPAQRREQPRAADAVRESRSGERGAHSRRQASPAVPARD